MSASFWDLRFLKSSGSIRIMYQSIPSLTIPLRANPQEMFWKGEFPNPPGTKQARKPDPWGKKVVLKPHPRGNYFQKSSKKPTKHETEIMKNWNANMFRNIVKHITAQSFFVDGFYGYSKYLTSFSTHLYKLTQEIHDKQVQKYDS